MGRTAALMDQARAATGLDDFGEDSFREGLDRLVDALDGEARLNELGRMATDAQIVGLLSDRLKIEDWYRRHPEIDDEAIIAPTIGIGLPRTGSTALACLMGEDDRVMTLRNHEAITPCPPTGFAPESEAGKIAVAEAAMERRARLFPRMQQMLPSTATSPTECQLFMGQDFRSQIFQAFAYIPSYSDWLEDEADMSSTYRHLKRVLKLLQWKRGPTRWRIKNPSHSLFIGALDAEFPDAQFVMTHRDVANVIPSVADLFFELSSAYSDHADRERLAELNVASWEKAMRRMIAFRDAGADDRFFDIPFRPFMRDPFPILERLYDWLGEELTPDVKARMQAWRTSTPRDKHGGHSYDAADFGIDIDALRQRFGFYFDRFDAVFAADKEEAAR